jgi:hypothetical protein
VFYTDASGNPQHGNELNEYGLQAAYSLLGVTSRAYIVRADLDLAQLVPSSSAPKGDPISGQFWVDTDATLYGVKTWNTATQKFTSVTPTILNDDSTTDQLSGGVPTASVGLVGDYAIVVTANKTENKLYYKASTGWEEVDVRFDSNKTLKVAPHTSVPDFTTDVTMQTLSKVSTGTSATNVIIVNTSSLVVGMEVTGDSGLGGTGDTTVITGIGAGQVTVADAHDLPFAGATLTFTEKFTPATGSVWMVTTTPNNGANWKVQYYNASTQAWVSVTAPIYADGAKANYGLDASGGGANIAVGTLFIDHTTSTSQLTLKRRSIKGATSVTTPASTFSGVGTFEFSIAESRANSQNFVHADITVTNASTATKLGSLIPAAIAASTLTNISASWDSTNNKLTLTHTKGGEFYLEDGGNTPLDELGWSTGYTATTNLYPSPEDVPYSFVASNWKPLDYVASNNAPTTDPADGTLWYSSIVDEVDILYHDGTTWKGYLNEFPNTDPNGPIVSATAPTEQTDGTALVNGDIWVSTADLERYGNDIYVYDGADWVQQNTADNSSPDGWLFADARWATAGNTLTASSIVALLSSNYLDPDAPDPALYPKGMRLWNTRRSGFNVKKYIVGHLDLEANDGTNIRYNDESMASYEADRWVCQNPIAEDGSAQFGRLGQRAQVTTAMKSLIDANTAIRDTDTLTFNLLAAPGYPEAIQNLITLNTDRGITAFVVGDTPFRLQPTGTALREWGMNTNLAFDNGDVGATSYDEYMAMYYPSGYTNDNTGNRIVVPASHMMLRTIVNSDARSYQWFAPAGTRRGGVENATSVGYIDSEGEFRTASLSQSLRDVLDDVKINPIATLTGVGLVAYGQRTRARNASALDRINVARLVVYLRRQLDVLARPFLFEPNDAQTRSELRAAAESLMIELVGQRALYDFIVICDESNNTPARIDRNELYLDIAIEPVKAVEFIYIPLRLKNTGDIAAGL